MVLGQYWVVLVSTWWYWVIFGWYWSVLGGTGSILGGTGQYFVFLGQYWIVLVKTTPKTTENHQKEPTSWLLLTGNSFVAKKLVPGQNVAPWRTPPGQNVAPMNTHDHLQNRLQKRHIVPGQYMSWDDMSRDKMSPDPKIACETFKSLDSCAPTKKRGWIIRLAFDNRTDKEGKKGREGGELSFGQNRSQCSAAFSMETCF